MSAPKIYFSEEKSAEAVIARMDPEKVDPRLLQVMQSAIRHLHAFVKDVEPTQAEWMAAIRFLTETGHMCSDWRQEFILLSDTLGVSMLVETINNRKPGGVTEATVLGPFHVAGAPHYEHGADICLDGKGEPMVIAGTVRNAAGEPIAGATLDVWQTNDEGFYDVQQKGHQPDMNLRGVFTSGQDGSYWLKSVKPRWYPIPDDGPVGKLLRATGRHPNRPAHVHFIVSADGYEAVTTHIFAPDDPWLDSDAVFGVKESLIGHIRKVDEPALIARYGMDGPFWLCEQDWVLARA